MTTTRRNGGMVATKAPDVWSKVWAKRGGRVVANHDVTCLARTATAEAFGAEAVQPAPWWKE